MKLVEAESVGPVEGEGAVVTAPRPPHRRVSISLVFTLTILVGTVVAIYVVFPARNDVVLSQAIASHREPPAWDLTAPTGSEARAWAMGVVGKDAPLPALDAPVRVIGVRKVSLLDRPAAVFRLGVGDDQLTYVVQPSHGIAPARTSRDAGELRAIAWRDAGYTAAAVGSAASAPTWLRLVHR